MDRAHDLYQRVTDQIVAAISAGADEYRMPWNSSINDATGLKIPFNPVGRYHYRGINVLSLWMGQRTAGFISGQWATYRQWLGVGAQVRKGEKGTLTVFFKPMDGGQASDEDDGDSKCRPRFIAKAAYVFNADQVDGYSPDRPIPVSSNETSRSDRAEYLLKTSGADIVFGGGRACYVPSRDQIHLPHFEAFIDPATYYGVAFHELTHWTGREGRCGRDLRNRFGSEAYAAEELIAELGAAYLSALVGIAPESRMDHASYISSWLTILRNDKRAIFTAAAKASQAADFILNLEGEVQLEPAA
jgi:antirestriction protein ArdC